MLVISNEKEDKWGKYFHHGELRKYMFSLDHYDMAKSQKEQIQRLKVCKYVGNIFPLSWKEQLKDLLDEKTINLLDQTMDDDYLKIPIRTHLMISYVTNNLKHLEIFKPWWLKEFDDVSLDAHKWEFGKNQNHTMNNVDRGLLGTGYTDFTSVNDGSASIRKYGIELENGDFIVGFCWEWYNK